MSDGVAMRKLGYTGASHYFSLPQRPPLRCLELKPKIEDSALETWARTALEGFRKEPGFKGFLVLREEQVSSAHLVTLWETKDQLLAARAKAASQKRRDDLAQLLPTPLKQRLCQVLLDTRL